MKVLRPILSWSLALLVLISSTSFAVGVHYCKGHVKSVALFTKAQGCEQQRKLPPCHRHLANSCCADEIIVHEGSDFKASVSIEPLPIPLPVDIAPPPVLLAELVPSSLAATRFPIPYDPPLRWCDRTVALSVFLI